MATNTDQEWLPQILRVLHHHFIWNNLHWYEHAKKNRFALLCGSLSYNKLELEYMC